MLHLGDEDYLDFIDIKADDLMTRYLKMKADEAKFHMKYFKKFKKVLPASKVARFFQIENKINAMEQQKNGKPFFYERS